MRIFEWFKNLDMKYQAFGVIGGFYFSNYFEPWVRRWWLWFNVLFCTFYSLLIISYYFVIDEKSDWKTTVFVFLWIQTFVYGVTIVPLVTFYFRNELEMVLRLNSKRDTENVEHVDHLKITKKNIIYTQIAFYTGYSGIYIGYFIYLSYYANADYFHDPKFYTVLNPWIPKISSPLQYFSFTISVGWINYVPILMTVSTQINMLVVAYEIYVAFTILHCHIAQLSELLKTPVYKFRIKYPSFRNSSRVNISYGKKIEEERRIIMKKMARAIESYQRLKRVLKSVKRYLEFQLSVWFICVVEVELFIISALYSPSITDIDIFRGVLIFILINVTMFCSCYTGMTFTTMGEMTTEKVYDIPWYNLHPCERRTFCIFLQLSQKPIFLNAVKIFTMGMPTFLQIAKLAYTYGNFLNNMYRRRS